MTVAKLLALPTMQQNLADEITLFLENLGRGSEKTASSYKRHINEFLTFISLDSNFITLEQLQQIKHKDVLMYVNHLSSKKNKSTTIDTKLAAMKSLWKFFAKDYGITVFNSAIWEVTLVKEENASHPEFTPEEFGSFLNFCKLQPEKALEKYLFFKTLYITGLRKEAVHTLTPSDIVMVRDISGDYVWVINAKDKGSKYLEVPISDEFQAELSDLYNSKIKTDRIFDINVKTLYKVIAQFKAKYNITKKLTIHSIKATSLTAAWNRTGDIKRVQEQGHHEDPAMTLKKYVRNGESLKSKMSYKMDSQVDTKTLADLSKDELLDIISKCSDSTKREILNHVNV